MKKIYIEPSVDMIEIDEDMMCISTSDTYATKDMEVMTKQRESVDFSDDSDWGF